MNKRIIMLAKIALILAAAQIHITAANFISNPANTPSNATYAMNNECKHPTLEEFKQQIEGSLSEPTTNHLNETDQGTIKTTIQKFIKDDEKDDELIALVLYIANQWELIKELGWQSDAVYKYVQSCLSGLYNSTKDGPTIQVDNPYHTGIVAAIANLKSHTKGNNKPRAALRALLYPGLNQSNQQTVIDKAEVQELTNDNKELTFYEKELIQIIEQCAHIFQKELIGKTNEKMQQKAGLILQHMSQFFLPIHDINQQWLQENKATIHELIAGPDNDLQTLIDKAIQNKDNAVICNKMAQVRPDLFLTLFLLYDHQKDLGQQPQQEDTEIIEIANTIQQNIKQAFLSSDENGAKQTTATQPTPEQQLLKEFLNFIMGWEIPQQTSNNNRSTIFKEAAEKIQQAAHKITSIKITQKQKDLLKLIKIAYSTIKITTIGELRKGKPHKSTCPAKDQTIYKIYIEMYEQILNKVLENDEIQPKQILQELTKHINELQQEEEKLKEKEEREKREKEEEKRKQEEAEQKAKEEARDIEDTFYYQLEEFENHAPWGPLSTQQQRTFLRQYIGNNIPKYLALLIQVNYHQIIPCTAGTDFIITANDIYNLLFHDPLDPIEYQQADPIITADDTENQISQIIKDLRKINDEEAEPSKVEQILSLLFTKAYTKLGLEGALTKLPELINAYNNEENTTLDPKYSLLLRHLVPVYEQLFREYAYLTKYKHYSAKYKIVQQQEQLYQIVQKFSDAYKNKLDKLTTDQKEEWERKEKEEADRINKEAEEWRRMKKEAKKNREQEEERKRKEKAQGRKIATTQKIINNLSATNNMIQLIMQILY